MAEACQQYGVRKLALLTIQQLCSEEVWTKGCLFGFLRNTGLIGHTSKSCFIQVSCSHLPPVFKKVFKEVKMWYVTPREILVQVTESPIKGSSLYFLSARKNKLGFLQSSKGNQIKERETTQKQ